MLAALVALGCSGDETTGPRSDDTLDVYPGIAPSVFPGGETVPLAYGGFHLEAMDANGGWVAAVVDLLRFAVAIDGGPARADLLERETISTMIRSATSTPLDRLVLLLRHGVAHTAQRR